MKFYLFTKKTETGDSRRCKYIVFALVILTKMVNADDIDITGRIINYKAEPVSGVHVLLKNAGVEAESDINGNFSLTGTMHTLYTPQTIHNVKPYLKGNNLYLNLPQQSKQVRVELFNLSGRIIRTILNAVYRPGAYTINISPYLSGIGRTMYILRVQIGNSVSYLKVLNMGQSISSSNTMTRSVTRHVNLRKNKAVDDTVIVSKASFKTHIRTINTYVDSLGDIMLFEDSIKVPPFTVVLDSSVLNKAVSVSRNDSVITINTGSLNNGVSFDTLEIGDILVCPISKSTPSGFLGKIENIETNGGEIILTTRKADLAEAIEFGCIDTILTFEVDESRLEGASLKKKKQGVIGNVSWSDMITVEFEDYILFDLDGDEKNTTNDQVKATFTITLKPEIILQQRIDNFLRTNFLLYADMSEDLMLRIEGEYHNDLDIPERVLKTIPFKPLLFTIFGWFPVVITSKLQIMIGLDGHLDVVFSAEASLHSQQNVGLNLSNGAFEIIGDYNDPSKTGNSVEPKFDAAAGVDVELRAYLKCALEALLYGTFGGEVNVKGYLKGTAHAGMEIENRDITPDINPWWQLFWGIECQAAWINNLAANPKSDYKTLLLYDRLFLQSAPFGLEADYSNDNVVLQWPAYKGADHYCVYYAKSPQVNNWNYNDLEEGKKIIHDGGTNLTIGSLNDYERYWFAISAVSMDKSEVESFSCKPVSAMKTLDFAAYPNEGQAPLEVSFQLLNTDLNSIECLWDFGDGAGGDEKKPVHIYYQTGNYTVSVTVTENGSPVILKKDNYITVTPAQPPKFKITWSKTSGTAPLNVSFNTTILPESGHIERWVWDFGDGDISFLKNPITIYEKKGTYNIQCVGEGPGGEGVATAENAITVEGNYIAESRKFFQGYEISGNISNDRVNGRNAIILDYDTLFSNVDGYFEVKMSDMESFNECTGKFFLDISRDKSVWEPLWVPYPDAVASSFITYTGSVYNEDRQFRYIAASSDNCKMELFNHTVFAKPKAFFISSVSECTTGDTVTFDATSSDSLNQPLIDFQWDFGDGSVGRGEIAKHVYHVPEIYYITLFITDNVGANDHTKDTVIVK
ncbi:MAG: PKD domain-containing protein [Chitinispirillaceae bacterium]|nr:PKD domain-containing protein [Chitinispirillaceae bacterium]